MSTMTVEMPTKDVHGMGAEVMARRDATVGFAFRSALWFIHGVEFSILQLAVRKGGRGNGSVQHWL